MSHRRSSTAAASWMLPIIAAQRVSHFPCTFPEQCTQHPQPTFEQPAGHAKVPVTVSRGGMHSCALHEATGRVLCWGAAARGQLGDEPLLDSGRAPSLMAAEARGPQEVVSVSAGADHSCATGRNGSVWCWGAGQYGQLGYGGLSDKATGRLVSYLPPSVDASAGGLHTCALQASGTVSCWGHGASGQLGCGSRERARYPVAVQQLTQVTSMCAGAFHSCAATRSGAAFCWGWNAQGQLGRADAMDDSTIPVLVQGVSDVASVACGYEHSCARRHDGFVHCWGQVVRGQLEQQDQQQLLWNWTARIEKLLDEAVAARDWVQPFGSIVSHYSLTPSPPPWG